MGQTHLLQVRKALDLIRLHLRLAECRQQHPGEDRDDRNHHQQLDQGECLPRAYVVAQYPGNRFTSVHPRHKSEPGDAGKAQIRSTP